MKFVLGVFVGAVLMLGSAYLHDTGQPARRPGAAVRQLGHRVRNAGTLTYGACLARWPALVPAILPNTAPFISPVPPG